MIKLVRDRVPESVRSPIIVSQGEKSLALPLLRLKLKEEVAEYLESGDVSELIDIYEVLVALWKAQGRDLDDMATEVQAVRASRGGFEKLIVMLFEG